MHLLLASAFLAFIAVVDGQQCSLKDRGFRQCVANYTNWVQVQLAQVRDASIRAISKLPEPLDKAIQLHEAALRRHLGKREIDQPESELRMEDAAAENRQRDDNARAWVKFRNDVCRIVDKAIANGSRQLSDGVRIMEHDKGTYDVRSLVCIYSSVSSINAKGDEALQIFYRTLPVDRRVLYERAVAFQLWIMALKIADIQKNLEKQAQDCYMLLT